MITCLRDMSPKNLVKKLRNDPGIAGRSASCSLLCNSELLHGDSLRGTVYLMVLRCHTVHAKR